MSPGAATSLGDEAALGRRLAAAASSGLGYGLACSRRNAQARALPRAKCSSTTWVVVHGSPRATARSLNPFTAAQTMGALRARWPACLQRSRLRGASDLVWTYSEGPRIRREPSVAGRAMPALRCGSSSTRATADARRCVHGLPLARLLRASTGCCPRGLSRTTSIRWHLAAGVLFRSLARNRCLCHAAVVALRRHAVDMPAPAARGKPSSERRPVLHYVLHLRAPTSVGPPGAALPWEARLAWSR